MNPTPHRIRGYQGRYTTNVAPLLGVFILSLCLGCVKTTNDSLEASPSSASAPLRTSDRAPSSDGIDVRWLVGEWQFLHDSKEVILIERTGPGKYAISPTKPESRFSKGSLNVFQIGCHRIAEVRWDTRQADNVGYAVLNGYAERLSLDLVPAIFPGAWRDPQLLKSLGLGPDQEVPPEMRNKAIAWFAEQIDSKGTLMHQDMTFYRPGSLD